MDDILDDAISAARRRYGTGHWLRLAPGEQTTAIYVEMRRLDLEHAAVGVADRARPGSPDAQARVVPTPPDRAATTRLVRPASRPGTVSPRCCAVIKTRTDRCSWQAAVIRNGQFYCGFHDPQRGRPMRRGKV
jgi:hypothetical protein